MLGDMYESWAEDEGMQPGPLFFSPFLWIVSNTISRNCQDKTSKQKIHRKWCLSPRSVRVQEVPGEAGLRSLTLQLSNLSGAVIWCHVWMSCFSIFFGQTWFEGATFVACWPSLECIASSEPRPLIAKPGTKGEKLEHANHANQANHMHCNI